jgi:hypothetical protein
MKAWFFGLLGFFFVVVVVFANVSGHFASFGKERYIIQEQRGKR